MSTKKCGVGSKKGIEVWAKDFLVGNCIHICFTFCLVLARKDFH